MTSRALIPVEDAKRLCRAAKAEGTAILVRKGNLEVYFLPNIPDIHNTAPLDHSDSDDPKPKAW